MNTKKGSTNMIKRNPNFSPSMNIFSRYLTILQFLLIKIPEKAQEKETEKFNLLSEDILLATRLEFTANINFHEWCIIWSKRFNGRKQIKNSVITAFFIYYYGILHDIDVSFTNKLTII